MIDMDKLLQEYQALWALSDPTLIAKTNTSHVYKVQHKSNVVVLKLYTQAGREDEARGPIFLDLCSGNSAAKVFKYDDNACLLEFIDGDVLIELVNQGKDEEATAIIGDVLKKIHQTKISNDTGLIDLKTYMRYLFKYAKGDCPDIVKRAAQVAEQYLKKPAPTCLLHGDMHHENVMHHPERGWLALDPKGVIGNPAFDLANTLHNPIPHKNLYHNEARLLKQVEILSQKTDIKSQDILESAYIHGALSSCWTKSDDGEHDEDRLKTSLILEKHIGLRT